MATGRIRRSARRGLGLAVLAWLGVAASSVLLAPGAAAAPTATVEIRNVTPPVASVDSGGTVTFVNKIPSENRGGISIPLPLGEVVVSATVHTDVALDFFGQRRDLQPEQSTSWQFTAPATTGTITYTYRVVPQANLPLGVSPQQVVDRVLASLPALPAPAPYVVQTIAPRLPNLPSVGVPQLPQVTVPVPGGTPPVEPPDPGPQPVPGPTPAAERQSPARDVADVGNAYQYPVGGDPAMGPGARAAIAAFDPARFGAASGGFAAAERAGSGSGSGGAAGSYDGASVPVFGRLAGLDGTTLDADSAETVSASQAQPVTLPAPALAAVVALAAVTAGLVRTHQAARENR